METATQNHMTPAERRETRDRIGRQHAEAALCHYAHPMGLSFSDEKFEREATELAQMISSRLSVAGTRG